MNAPFPDAVVSCSFNNLPFSRKAHDYCAIAFLCLHHSNSIEQAVMRIMEIFDQAIIFEPLTNSFLKPLSYLGIAQRKEGVDYSPARLHIRSFREWRDLFDITQKTYLKFPRDYLPLLSHAQQKTFNEDGMKRTERFLSKMFFAIQKGTNKFLARIGICNMALLHLKEKYAR